MYIYLYIYIWFNQYIISKRKYEENATHYSTTLYINLSMFVRQLFSNKWIRKTNIQTWLFICSQKMQLPSITGVPVFCCSLLFRFFLMKLFTAHIFCAILPDLILWLHCIKIYGLEIWDTYLDIKPKEIYL